jgi:hypothetical protein
MTNSEIRLKIKILKSDIPYFAPVNKPAMMRAVRNLTKFEQVAEERKLSLM